MIHTLIFDFDGLILDTETPDYTAWQEIYAGYGCALSIDDWGQIIGGTGFSDFDAVSELEKLTGLVLDRDALNTRWRERGDALIASLPVLPGVKEYLETATRLGLRMAVASSSDHAWVDTHLKRLGLWQYFETVICRDDVQRTKPDPELFLKALAALHATAEEALVFEDSPNGIKAARAAGIRAVAVPNHLTGQLKIIGADLVLSSLADLSLQDLLLRFNLVIREETPADAAGIRDLHCRAFGRTNEADLVDLIRERGKAHLSLVASEEERILGHLLLTPVILEPDRPGLRGLGLGPLAVLPEVQGRGIGTQLIGKAVESCRAQGYDFLVVLGDPGYYSNFGFLPAARFGMTNEYDVEEAFQVLELKRGLKNKVQALVRYLPEFSEVDC